jgi:hypothetical protein
MRRVIFFMLTTLDGYIEGPNRFLDWHRVDEEFNEGVTALKGLIRAAAAYNISGDKQK